MHCLQSDWHGRVSPCPKLRKVHTHHHHHHKSKLTCHWRTSMKWSMDVRVCLASHRSILLIFLYIFWNYHRRDQFKIMFSWEKHLKAMRERESNKWSRRREKKRSERRPWACIHHCIGTVWWWVAACMQSSDELFVRWHCTTYVLLHELGMVPRPGRCRL